MQAFGFWSSAVAGRQATAPYVRIAQLDVDPPHLQAFKAELHESIAASIRVEPGVLTLFAIVLKEQPNRFLVFEMYKDEAAYNAHRETAPFRKFFESTRAMVMLRTFLDVDPVVLGAKAYWDHRTTDASVGHDSHDTVSPRDAAVSIASDKEKSTTMTTEPTLSAMQQAIAPIAAYTAIGDLPHLNTALEQGLDAGLSISDCKEILVQMYAYAGFPRSINALTELMKLLQVRKQRGIIDAQGRNPGPVPEGAALLATGTANQTKLSGAPVKGALFEFAPAIDLYLKMHLFGGIFARDNLDWQSRELATVAALAALPGVEPQLQAHMRISMNAGLGAAQLQQLANVLAEQVSPDAGQRAEAVLKAQLSAE